jgi:hypothetical protein
MEYERLVPNLPENPQRKSLPLSPFSSSFLLPLLNTLQYQPLPLQKHPSDTLISLQIRRQTLGLAAHDGRDGETVERRVAM